MAIGIRFIFVEPFVLELPAMTWVLAVTGTLIGIPIVVLLLISLQPKRCRDYGLSVPAMPFLPGFCIFVNLYLMVMLDSMAWIRLAVWMVLGNIT